MKTKRILFLALIVCAAFAVSAQAGDRHRNKGNGQSTGSSSAHYSSPAIHSSSGVRYGGNRTFAASPRMTTRSMPQFSQRHIISGENAPIVHRQFTPRTFSERTGNGVGQFQNNRQTRSEGLAQFQHNQSMEANRLSQMQSQRGNRFAQLQNPRRRGGGASDHGFFQRLAPDEVLIEECGDGECHRRSAWCNGRRRGR